jgi:hypothetical protein
MRKTLTLLLATAALVAAIAPGYGCPAGYVSCGARYCCPR